MRQTRNIMGMPVTVEVVGVMTSGMIDRTFEYFRSVDERFSTYKPASEISRINRGEMRASAYSDAMKEVLRLAERTKRETDGYFDIRTPGGGIDPSGLVKGWAINNAAELLRERGFENFYVEAGGDIQTSGMNAEGAGWKIGIRDPFDRNEIVKVVYPHGRGIATSGTAARGAHIWNPHTGKEAVGDIVSLTVIGPNVYEADRFATAAFAMGAQGVHFIEALDGFEAYVIDRHGIATMTTGLDKFLC